MHGLTEIFVYSDSESGMEQLLLGDDTVDKFAALEYVTGVEAMLNAYMPVQAGKYESYFEVVGVGQKFMEEIELGEGELPDKKGDTLKLVVGNALLEDFYDSQTGEYPYWEKEELPDIDFMTTPLYLGIEKEENFLLDEEEETDSSAAYYDPTFSDEESDFDSVNSDEDFSYEDESDGMENDLADGEYGSDDSDIWSDDSDGELGEPESYSMFSGDMKKVPVKVSGVVADGSDAYSEFAYAAYADIDVLKTFLKKNYTQNEVIPGQPTDKNGKPFRDLKYTQLIVSVDEAKNVEAVLQEIQNMGFRGEANKEWIEEIEKEFMIIEAVLGSIGAIAMLVAAISIANTMTMSTYERTKEIGVMKVLGCNLGNIRSMFLSEAACIGFLGGIVGVILSFILSAVLNKFLAPNFMSDEFGIEACISVIPFWLVSLAVIFATIIGMVAGFFPAQRLTKLSPLAAIRNE